MSPRESPFLQPLSLSKKFPFCLKENGTHTWQELYNLFKLNTKFLGNESVHATILGKRSEIVVSRTNFASQSLLRVFLQTKLFQFVFPFHSTIFFFAPRYCYVRSLWGVYYSMIYFGAEQHKKKVGKLFS
jgi:hypothetical protein